MTTSVLVPWAPGCPHREDAWKWVQARFASEHPDWEVVEGSSPPGPFSRTAAILDALGRASGDRLLVLDADIWSDFSEAMEMVGEHGWAVPHRLVHRLSAESTEKVLAGADWRGLPLSSDNSQDAKPYKGLECGGAVAFRRDALEAVPPDPRFRGWGQEEVSHAAALRTLIGKPWRGDADLVHLWHPSQPRMNRRIGSRESVALMRRYVAARGRKTKMLDLIQEHRQDPQGAATVGSAVRHPQEQR